MTHDIGGHVGRCQGGVGGGRAAIENNCRALGRRQCGERQRCLSTFHRANEIGGDTPSSKSALHVFAERIVADLRRQCDSQPELRGGYRHVRGATAHGLLEVLLTVEPDVRFHRVQVDADATDAEDIYGFHWIIRGWVRRRRSDT